MAPNKCTQQIENKEYTEFEQCHPHDVKCIWCDANTGSAIIQSGRVDLLERFIHNGGRLSSLNVIYAVMSNSVSMMEYLIQNHSKAIGLDDYRFDNDKQFTHMVYYALEHGCCSIANWAVKNGGKISSNMYKHAAGYANSSGSCVSLDWLLKRKCPWDADVVFRDELVMVGLNEVSPIVTQWAIENGLDV